MAYYNTPYNYGYYPQLQPMMPMIYPQQQMFEQSQQMLPAQTSQNSTEQSNNSYMVWVQGKAGAQSYPVARGTTLPLFDSEGDFVYIKSVDNNGIPLPLVTKMISDPPIEVKEEIKTTEMQIDTSKYVTKDTYEDLKKKYEELELRIMDIETKPSSFTSNFTGNTFNNSRKDGKDNGNKFTI